eukprot:CAMPEP_0203682576 /NCGR_PEP_ID=MMETSP0090-20130426/46366_1 /ASSEMBLY_ACC=CAM_ASM_001088 /TAXON_ID=426623 /ORGANISM="Chaetoceros affinis, Strain CCMP159" /LENGTH=47 /DNA_ID= /DNA_START= /DNA_END= /DNA_ORIENTATION=
MTMASSSGNNNNGNDNDSNNNDKDDDLVADTIALNYDIGIIVSNDTK